MGTIIVNGVKIEARGGNITVRSGKVMVDGTSIEIKDDVRDVHIEGNVGCIYADGSVTVKGNVTGDVDAGGSVECGNVGGDVDAGGSVEAKDVAGDIDAGGSVQVRKG